MATPTISQENLCDKSSGSPLISKSTLVIVSIVVIIIMAALIITIAILAVTISAASKSSKSAERQCDKPECFMFASEILKGIDNSVDPCTDFFEYTCGNLKKYDYVIEDDEIWQNEFLKANTQIFLRIRDLLEGDLSDNDDSPLLKGQKMYKSCLNEQDIKNIEALKNLTTELGGWPIVLGDSWENQSRISDFGDLASFYSQLFQYRFNGILFSFSVVPDYKDNAHQIATFFLPSMKFILNRTVNQQSQIRQLLRKMTKPFNSSVDESLITRDIEGILKVNDEIRKITDQYVSKQFTLYNKTTVGLLSKIIPNIDWIDFLNKTFQNKKAWSESDEIVVMGIDYFSAISKKLSEKVFSVRDLVNYELLNIVQDSYPHFPPDTLKQTSNFLSLLNTEDELYVEYPRTNKPRWKYCVNTVIQWLKFALAKKYADLYFNSGLAEEEAKDITANIVEVFQKDLENAPWLDNKTRIIAEEKLKNMRQYYLYPEKPINNENLTIYYNDLIVYPQHIRNLWSYNKFQREKILKTLWSPESKETFTDSVPLDVNAFYRANENAMYILLGIVQIPIFHVDRLRLMNFATLGSIIGHEITHGYDLNGQLFDQNGNIKSWLSENAKTTFYNKTKCFIDQYSNYSLTSEDLPGSNETKVNGHNTVNENIADNGGIRHAFQAYQNWVQKNGHEKLPDALFDFTVEQVFFLSYAHSNCLKYSYSKNLRSSIIRDKHSPSKFRVIGSLSNFEEFSKAFHCTAEKPMVRSDKERCRLW